MTNEKINEVKSIDKYFPKGNKRRGEVLCIVAEAFLLGIVFLFGLGILMNSTVINANDGKMPVLTNNPLEIKYSGTHFTYNNSEDINMSILADNYKIGRHYFSVGDVYISLSIIIFIIFLSILLINYLKEK